jgi:HSP20 family protein
MNDSMSNQRPAGEQKSTENTSLSKRDEGQAISPYYGWRTSPFELMRRFSEDVDRIFSSFGFGNWGLGNTLSPPLSSMGTSMSSWTPPVDISTKGDDLVVSVDLPGLKPEEVQIEAEDNRLIIRGEHRDERSDKDEDKGYWYSERSYGSFYRAIPLPAGVNADNAQAYFNNGVLELTLPGAAKKLKPQRRPIQIQGAQQTSMNEAGAQQTQQYEQTSQQWQSGQSSGQASGGNIATKPTTDERPTTNP